MSSVYAGKIANSGAQVVKAPAQTVQPKRGTVQIGRDLRAGTDEPMPPARAAHKPNTRGSVIRKP